MNYNFRIGSNKCPIVNECKNINQGIAQGDLNKTSFNVGLIGLYALSMGNKVPNTNLKIKLNVLSSKSLCGQIGAVSTLNQNIGNSRI